MGTEYRNDFTRFLDEYRKDTIMKQEDWFRNCMSTYLWYPDIEDDFKFYDGVKGKIIAFRLPGATRGHILVDKDYVIKEIVFYKDTCFGHKINEINCYKEEVVEAANKEYIGKVLDIHNGIVGE